MVALLLSLIPSLPTLAQMTSDAAKDAEPLAPRCFAYAPKLQTFACVGHDRIYNTDHVGAQDQATNIAIDIIGPKVHERWTIAAIGGRKTTPRAKVEKRLSALGMKPLTAPPVAVPANRWVSVGAEQISLRVSPHEGDASFENLGELTLRCAAGIEVKADLRDAGLELGETTVAWRIDDVLAVSIVGVDGGEDTTELSLDTAVIDVARTCQQQKLAMWVR